MLEVVQNLTKYYLIYLKIRHIFKSRNIYLKPKCFCKSKLTLSDFTLDNVNFDLRTRLVFKYILQLLNMSYF